MSQFTLCTVKYSNFKHIPYNVQSSFDIASKNSGQNITILDGPNGYGKTTLFEAIELVLTGEIRDFKKNLPSVGLENYQILANDPNYPMQLEIDFRSENGIILNVSRTWTFQNKNQDSVLYLNGNIIKQEDLQTKLNFTNQMFNLGMYLSQKESLSFLQNRYKDRGSQLASVLDTTDIQDKITFIESVKKQLQEKQTHITESLEAQCSILKESQSNLKKHLEAAVKNSLVPSYERLFVEKEYDFDLPQISTDLSYDDFVAPLDQLEDFLDNYPSYCVACTNNSIDKLLLVDKKTYKSLFFRKFTSILAENSQLINTLQFVKAASEKLKKHQYPINCNVYAPVGVSQEDIDALNKISVEIQITKKQLGLKESAIQKILDSRSDFLAVYNNNKANASLDFHICPLCGTKLDNLFMAIEQAEVELQSSCSTLQQHIISCKTTQSEIGNRIVCFFDSIISKHKSLLEMYDSLSDILAYDPSTLENGLNSIGITQFICNDSQPSETSFENAYENLLEILRSKKQPGTTISKQKLTSYSNIHDQYYQNNVPIHTVNQIQQKKKYLAFIYSQKVASEYHTVTEQIDKITGKIGKLSQLYSDKIKILGTIVDKYKNAETTYNKQIQQALHLPIYIYSGRIIQNYPLGLGIYAEINDKKIILKPELKDDDVYNVLSAGQLNGLALAVLLSVHAVYAKNVKFNLMMIDDPLQTIDEVSSISLLDLLIEQSSTGQILLSTHEPYKADLFQYKFAQSGFNVERINMHQEYLKLQTN